MSIRKWCNVPMYIVYAKPYLQIYQPNSNSSASQEQRPINEKRYKEMAKFRIAASLLSTSFGAHKQRADRAFGDGLHSIYWWCDWIWYKRKFHSSQRCIWYKPLPDFLKNKISKLFQKKLLIKHDRKSLGFIPSTRRFTFSRFTL